MQSDNQTLALTQPADSRTLSAALNGLTRTVFQAAEENLRETLGSDFNQYTALERRSMIATEALRLTNGMDLAAIMSRGEIIAQIEREGLTGVHPNGYANLTQLAQEN